MTTGKSQEQEPDQAASAPKAASTPTSPSKRRSQPRRKSMATEASKKGSASGTARKKSGTSGSSRGGGARRSASRTAVVEETKDAPSVQTRPPPRLLARYREETAPDLMKEFGYKSAMQVPRISKIVLNIGLGEALQNPRAVENATRDMSLITGQLPMTNRARKSIAAFKVREGMVVGLSVTLRGRRMYEFFDRLVSSALPRIRDFRGLSRESFDGRGSYSLGIREQVIFPEIDYNSIDRIRSLQIAIVTTAQTDREGLRLLELMGMPFERPETAAAAA